MWKVVGASVTGSSHERQATPCQDFNSYTACKIGDKQAFLVGIADGAGSAALAHIGSKESVQHMTSLIANYSGDLTEVSEKDAEDWINKTRTYLKEVAQRESCEFGDLACTILVAVLTDAFSIFFQIGDGAWIIENNGIYSHVTWPYAGEFANQTKFLTSPDALDFLQFKIVLKPHTGFAGFSDGIQLLALHYATKSVHAPFFDPLFTPLKNSCEPTDLVAPLMGFLNCAPIQERSDDDKTLVLGSKHEVKLLQNALV